MGEAPSVIFSSAESTKYFDIIPSLTNFAYPVALLAIIGLVITVVLMLLKIKGSILIGILGTTIIGIFMGVTQVPDFSTMSFGIPSLAPTFFKFDFVGLFNDPTKVFFVITTIFAFSLSDIFDTISKVASWTCF